MLRILHEDNHLIAVEKPPGVATMGVRPPEKSMFDLVKEYLKQKYNKPGNVYLGVVSRLDAPVTGALLFARTSKAASRLSAAFKGRSVDKRYLAVVHGDAPSAEEAVVHYLCKDERNQRMYATREDAPGAQRAELRYQVLIATAERSLLEVQLLTGRKHQIRTQLSKLGMPVVGDAKYGSHARYDYGIALHSWRLNFDHPVRQEPLQLEAAIPKPWSRWLGGRIADRVAEAKENPTWD